MFGATHASSDVYGWKREDESDQEEAAGNSPSNQNLNDRRRNPSGKLLDCSIREINFNEEPPHLPSLASRAVRMHQRPRKRRIGDSRIVSLLSSNNESV
jgi:hypothetical protein